MGRSKINGAKGEQAARLLLEFEGWEILEEQHKVTAGYKIDLLARDPDGIETLVEVKSWGAVPGGTDTVRKAVAVAYDLVAAGETRPYVLVLSRHLTGVDLDMLRRALVSGAIDRVRVFGFVDLSVGVP